MGRFSQTFRTESAVGSGVALIGLPDDVGVSMNGGRAGAKEGPGAIRRALAAYGGGYDGLLGREISAAVYDAGDVEVSPLGDRAEALHETHERVTAAVLAAHEMGMVPVCLGGGHDLTFASVRALSVYTGAAVSGVNVDAHLDVRAEAGSGMPFRSLIDGGYLNARCFTVVGAGRFANSGEHHEWLLERGGRIIDAEAVLRSDAGMKEAFRRLATGDAPAQPGFVTIDLDGIDGSQAPGVSAVNPMGLGVLHAVQAARLAGMRENVRHFDVMELNPEHDDGGRTARVAALLVLTFLAGFSSRGG